MTKRSGGGLIFVLPLLLVLAQASAAWAHASLIRSEPAADAVLPQSPAALKLHFNEPVSPLVMRIVGPNGEAITPAAAAENETVTLTPPPLGRGTHVLSWRVISADGHPVGGSLLFSVVAASGGPGAGVLETDPAVGTAIWAGKLALYLGLFIGIGGTVFTAWISAGRAPAGRARTLMTTALVLSAPAALLSIGFQGLDALALPLRELGRGEVWRTGLATAFGQTAVIATIALLLALASLRTRPNWRRSLSLVALLGAGLALAMSGHASTAGPWMVSRPSVFLHVVCVAVWIGSLVPLATALRHGPTDDSALRRFSRAIPIPLALLGATGLILAYLQLDRIDALWTTSYGEVLLCKLVLVAALLGLAAANRYWLVPRFETRGVRAARPLVASIAAETVIAVVILGLVATWRFTPPPRALAAALEPIAFHIHGAPAMANFELTPSRGRGARLDILVLDTEIRPLAVKEVTLIISNPKAGIEPMRRDAVFEGTRTGGSTTCVSPLPAGGMSSLTC